MNFGLNLNEMHPVVWTVSDNDEWSEIWFVFFEKIAMVTLNSDLS